MLDSGNSTNHEKSILKKIQKVKMKIISSTWAIIVPNPECPTNITKLLAAPASNMMTALLLENDHFASRAFLHLLLS
jgi:hypothetical protein